jgi:membrane protein CcdC involved in cytochrome C biogenesis
MSDAPPPPAGWFPDPEEPALLRYWDGAAWTDQRVARQPTAAPVAEEGPQQPIAVPPLLAAGALLIVAGVGRAVSYLAPYEAFGISLAFSVVEILGWVGAFLCFVAAGYPSRRTGARVLSLILVGIYVVSGIISIAIALNPFGPAGLIALAGLLGLATFGVGIAFAVTTIRTPGLVWRVRFLPLALFLGLLAFGLIAGVANAAAASTGAVAATAGIVIAGISGLVPATVGALFLAFGRWPHAADD